MCIPPTLYHLVDNVSLQSRLLPPVLFHCWNSWMTHPSCSSHCGWSQHQWNIPEVCSGLLFLLWGWRGRHHPQDTHTLQFGYCSVHLHSKLNREISVCLRCFFWWFSLWQWDLEQRMLTEIFDLKSIELLSVQHNTLTQPTPLTGQVALKQAIVTFTSPKCNRHM